mgnify:CR=1 FL=1
MVRPPRRSSRDTKGPRLVTRVTARWWQPNLELKHCHTICCCAERPCGDPTGSCETPLPMDSSKAIRSCANLQDWSTLQPSQRISGLADSAESSSFPTRYASRSCCTVHVRIAVRLDSRSTSKVLVPVLHEVSLPSLPVSKSGYREAPHKKTDAWTASWRHSP